jgi:LPS-assembly lipoprotein
MLAPGGERDGVRNDERLAAELAAVRVANIPDRTGQVMRRALQRRLEDTRPGTPAKYELQAAFNVATEILGYRRDGLITRVRYVATGNWALATLSDTPQVLARGAPRTLDAYNIPDLQFFAADSSRADMENRMITELSDQIYFGVVAALRARLRA